MSYTVYGRENEHNLDLFCVAWRYDLYIIYIYYYLYIIYLLYYYSIYLFIYYIYLMSLVFRVRRVNLKLEYLPMRCDERFYIGEKVQRIYYDPYDSFIFNAPSFCQKRIIKLPVKPRSSSSIAVFHTFFCRWNVWSL
jgi:hypothetical protein